MYEKLFEPMNIGSLTLPNRFVMPAMNSHYADEIIILQSRLIIITVNVLLAALDF